MSARAHKPENPVEACKHLACLCQQGRLYEAEEWLAAGNSAARPPDARHCPLRIATEKGFHSMVKLLLRSGCSDEQKLGALKEAARVADFGIVELLVEAGAPVASLPYWCLDEVVSRPLIEHLLDHGLDLARQDGLAQMLTYRRIKPLLGLFLQNRKRFPDWEIQAAKALCHFVIKRDEKWVSLMIWAKADPLMKVAPISEDEDAAGDDDYRQCAAEIALNHDEHEMFAMLKVQPTPEQADELLQSIWSMPSLRVLELLFNAGAQPNLYDPEEGSVLHRALDSYGRACDSRFSGPDPREEIEKIAWLIRKRVKWRLPKNYQWLGSLRRRFYYGPAELAVEVIRLLDAGNVCDKQQLREFIDKPKMRGWVRQHEPELLRRLLPACG